MAAIHSLRIQPAWPWGQRGKKHYRAGCSCGWLDSETFPLRRSAESKHTEHKEQEKRDANQEQ